MINTQHSAILTDAQRRVALFRAQHTQPFFNLLTFPVDITGVRRNEYRAKVNVNKDFYLTEILGNFNELEFDSGFANKWDVSYYTGRRDGSLYRYMQGLLLPSGFSTTEGRSLERQFTDQRFVDLQDEYFPYHIQINDQILGQIKSQFTKTIPARVLFKGYYIETRNHFDTQLTRLINDSLAAPVQLETWERDLELVTGNRQPINISYENDRKPRLVLGFAFKPESYDQAITYDPVVQITDSFRNAIWTNEPIPLTYFAPSTANGQLGCRDLTYYYLPVEYLLQPFSTLRLTIGFNGSPTEGYGGKITMLTRTV